MAFAPFLLLIAAAAATAADTDPPPDPAGDLRQMVVQAIRDCGQRGDEIVACSRDRGYAQEERLRLRKLKKPRPVDGGAGIKVQVVAGQPGSGQSNSGQSDTGSPGSGKE